jgi:hypothetical protein
MRQSPQRLNLKWYGKCISAHCFGTAHNCKLPPAQDSSVEEGIYTIVRLADSGTLERACQLAGISPSDVTLTQKIGERTPQELSGDFRIISFDGGQITISESINGERRTRGFAVE